MFIILGRNIRTMARVYYTGRAGDGWLSERRADAFTYATETEANRKARMFTRNQRLHGCTFWTDHADPADAHAAGARAMSEDACGPF